MYIDTSVSIAYGFGHDFEVPVNRMLMPNEYSNFRKLTFAITAIFLIILFCETLLHVSGFSFQQDPSQNLVQWVQASNKILATDTRFAKIPSEVPSQAKSEKESGLLEFDPELFWHIHRPNPIFNINRQGFRGDDLPAVKEMNEYRILFLGDSCFWGYRLDYRETSAFQLQERLNSESTGFVRVINAGVPGYSTFQGKLYFQKRLEWVKPDVIVVYFGRNDSRVSPPMWNGRPDKDQKHLSETVFTIRRFLGKLKLFQLTAFLIHHCSELMTSPVPFAPNTDDAEMKYLLTERTLPDEMKRVSGKDFMLNISAIADLAINRGAYPILLTTPVIPETVGNYNAELKKLAETRNYPLIDLEPIFEKDKYNRAYIMDECHPTALGNQIIAGLLAERILKIWGEDRQIHENTLP
jgi:lysophospholipase L1-like esterase